MADVYVLKGSDIPAARKATVWIKTADGIEHQAPEVQTLEASLEKNQDEYNVLGKMFPIVKTTSITGTGTIDYLNGELQMLFVGMMERLANESIEEYFELIVEHYDPSTSIGKYSVLLRECTISTANIVNVDVTNPAATGSTDFTFEGFQILDRYRREVALTDIF